jgi:LPS sulfotransferase NodH
MREAMRGLVHSGSVQQMLAYLSSLAFWLQKPTEKFVIFTQGRTGGQLLVDLLNSSPQVRCDHEILQERVLFPKRYVEGKGRRSGANVYGFRVKIYQLTDTQGIKDPEGFMNALHQGGWKIIYLRRDNILRQALSYLFAVERDSWQHRLSDGPVELDKIFVDCDRLIELLEEREARLEDEAEVLQHLPHATVVYEEDLLRAEHHQTAADRLFDYLGVPPIPVRTDRVRTSVDRLSNMIENFDQVSEGIGRTKYAYLLDE